MKRFLLLTASVAMLCTLSSCKKDKKGPAVDPALPTIELDSNSAFSIQEMTTSLDAIVTVKAAGRIDALTLTLDLGEYYVLANQYIKTAVNKGTASKQPVFDVIDDTECAKFLAGIGITAGTIVRGKTETDLNLLTILDGLLGRQVVENDKTFSVKIDVVDQEGNTVSKTAKFHFTAAPEFSWEANSTFAVVNLDDAAIDATVKIWAPGKFDVLTVTLAEDADPALVSWVKNRTTDGTLVIDLVNDSKVVTDKSFGSAFPVGTAVSGVENVALDFAFLYEKKFDMSASTNVFSVRAVDQNGKETVQDVKFRKK